MTLRPLLLLPLLLLPLLAMVGCTDLSTALEEDMVSSMTYDATSCGELVARRDALAAAHGIGADSSTLVPGERPSYVVPGAGPLVPDLRLPRTRERSRAIGEIRAMDGSISRRGCRGR